MMVLALWFVCGFFLILLYPHTPGRTDIKTFGNLAEFIILWPCSLARTLEEMDNAKFA